MILISSDKQNINNIFKIEKSQEFTNSKRKNPYTINNNSNYNSNINNNNSKLNTNNHNNNSNNNDLPLVENSNIVCDNKEIPNEKFPNDPLLKNLYDNDMYFKVLCDITCVGKDFISKYKKYDIHNLLFLMLYNDNIEYILKEEVNLSTEFQKLYNSTTDESIKEFYRTNKDFQMLYLLSDKFREKYHNNKEYRNDVHDNQLLSVEFLLHVSPQFKKLYDTNEKFKELCSNKEFLFKYCYDKSIRTAFHCNENIETNSTKYHNYKRHIYDSFLLHTENLLFKYLYDNDMYFYLLYNYNSYFCLQCRNNLEFLGEYKLENISQLLFNILYSDDIEYASHRNKTEKELCRKFQELYNNTTDESIKEFYRTNKDFQILYLVQSKFREQYGTNILYEDVIHDDKQMAFFIFHGGSIEFRELYNINEKFQQLCNNKEFLDEYSINGLDRYFIHSNKYKEKYISYFFNKYENSLFNKVSSNHKNFKLLYVLNNYFYEKCNDTEFLKEYKFENLSQLLFNILYSDDIEYTSHRNEEEKDICKKFQELYNNTTDESTKEFYRTNKDFQILYLLYIKFREKYNNEKEYRDEIKNHKNFLNKEFLLHKDKKFQQLYKNKKTKKLYDTNEKFQQLCENKYFINFYFDNPYYQLRFYINKTEDINIQFLNGEYLLYTNKKISKLYYTNKMFQETYDNSKQFQQLCENEEFLEEYCKNKDYQNEICNNDDFLNENFLLYTDENFKANHNTIKENEYFKQLYLTENFKNKYYNSIDFRNSIYNNKDFLFIEFKKLNNKIFNIMYENSDQFKILYNKNKKFQQLCENKEFLEKYIEDQDLKVNIFYFPSIIEKCYEKYINNNI